MSDIVERLNNAKWQENEDGVIELKNFMIALDAKDEIEVLTAEIEKLKAQMQKMEKAFSHIETMANAARRRK